MTKYLSMNGIGDVVSVSNGIAYDNFSMDCLINQPSDTTLRYLIDSLSRSSGGYIRYNGSWANNMSATGLIFGQRTTVTGKISTPYTGWIKFFNSAAGFSGNIYDIKLYNGLALVGHYDMSTGTVNDQSGNGNNATLTGGTWLDDGAGATGTPVTYTYDTKQSIYANVQSNYDTKQSIYANRLTNFDTQQSIYQPINQSYDTKQAVYKSVQELFDTEQIFTAVSNQVTYQYDMKIQQYKDIQESLDTKQSYYSDISIDLDTKQVIYKQIQNLYDTLIQIRNKHDETLYGTLTIQRVIEHRLTINKRHSEDLKIERVLNHILRV